MSLYNPDAVCPKCGFRHVSTKYSYADGGLIRGCLQCGYWWLEECLDSPISGRVSAIEEWQTSQGAGKERE
jgi:hypothetical protein